MHWIDRFLSYIKPTDDADGCWEWFAYLDTKGYGRFRINKTYFAHRLSYILFNGDIPEGLLIRHICNNPKCVNPEHLLTGTQQDNINDMMNAGRQAKGEKHGLSKLTEAQVLEIRASNLLQKDIAKQYNVCKAIIHLIKSKKRWGHI